MLEEQAHAPAPLGVLVHHEPHAELESELLHRQLHEAVALRRAASGETLGERGAVRVTAPDIMGVEVLPPALASFREAHPGIAVELVLSNRTADLGRREADIAVRTVKPTQASLVARKLGVARIRVHAHPRYLQAHGTPRSVDALLSHSFVGFDTAASVRSLPDMPFEVTRDLFAFRCDSDVGQYAALSSAAASSTRLTRGRGVVSGASLCRATTSRVVA